MKEGNQKNVSSSAVKKFRKNMKDGRFIIINLSLALVMLLVLFMKMNIF